MKAPEYYYLMVTNDMFELPLIVGDTAAEIAKICGCDASTVKHSVIRWEKGLHQSQKGKHGRAFRRVRREHGKNQN